MAMPSARAIHCKSSPFPSHRAGRGCGLSVAIPIAELPTALPPECQRRQLGLLAEEIGKVRYLFKAERVGNLRDIPIGLFEQDFGFLNNAAADDGGGSFAGVFFQYFIKVIYVYGQPIGVIFGGAKV